MNTPFWQFFVPFILKNLWYLPVWRHASCTQWGEGATTTFYTERIPSKVQPLTSLYTCTTFEKKKRKKKTFILTQHTTYVIKTNIKYKLLGSCVKNKEIYQQKKIKTANIIYVPNSRNGTETEMPSLALGICESHQSYF